MRICYLMDSDSIGYLVDDNAAGKSLWEESQALICLWSYAGSLAALGPLGNLEMQSRARFEMCCHAGTGAFVMASDTL